MANAQVPPYCAYTHGDDKYHPSRLLKGNLGSQAADFLVMNFLIRSDMLDTGG